MVRSPDRTDFPITGYILGFPVIALWYWCTDQVSAKKVLFFHSMLRSFSPALSYTTLFFLFHPYFFFISLHAIHVLVFLFFPFFLSSFLYLLFLSSYLLHCIFSPSFSSIFIFIVCTCFAILVLGIRLVQPFQEEP